MESIASSKRMNSIARVRFDQDSFDLDAATTHNEEIDVMELIASSKRMNSIARVRFDQDSFDLDAATTHLHFWLWP